MTLATHGVVGSLVAQSLAWNPWLAIPVAFISHFILDTIPHWDYKLYSVTGNYNNSLTWKFSYGYTFIVDVFKVFIDFFIGVVIVLGLIWLFDFQFSWVGWLGLLVAVSPDFFHFIYSHFPYPLINRLQRFHQFVHSDIRLDNRPLLGIGLQAIFISLVIFIFNSIG